MPGRPLALAVLPGVQARGVVLALCLLGCASAGAQTSGPPAAPRPAPQPQPQPQNSGGTPPATGVDVGALPISLNRISEGLERTPVLDLGATRPTFRVQIVGTRPRWSTGIDWLNTADGMKPPAGAPWHGQFLDMVTPPEARGFGAFQGTDLLQVLGTSLAQGLAAGAVAGKIKSALRDRRERQAREEVDAAIAAWKKERDIEAAAKRAQQQDKAAAPEQTAPP